VLLRCIGRAYSQGRRLKEREGLRRKEGSSLVFT